MSNRTRIDRTIVLLDGTEQECSFYAPTDRAENVAANLDELFPAALNARGSISVLGDKLESTRASYGIPPTGTVGDEQLKADWERVRDYAVELSSFPSWDALRKAIQRARGQENGDGEPKPQGTSLVACVRAVKRAADKMDKREPKDISEVKTAASELAPVIAQLENALAKMRETVAASEQDATAVRAAG